MMIAAFIFSVGPARAGAPQDLAMHVEAYNRVYPLDPAHNGRSTTASKTDSVVSNNVDWSSYALPAALGTAVVSYMLYAAHKKNYSH